MAAAITERQQKQEPVSFHTQFDPADAISNLTAEQIEDIAKKVCCRIMRTLGVDLDTNRNVIQIPIEGQTPIYQHYVEDSEFMKTCLPAVVRALTHSFSLPQNFTTPRRGMGLDVCELLENTKYQPKYDTWKIVISIQLPAKQLVFILDEIGDGNLVNGDQFTLFQARGCARERSLIYPVAI